MFAFILILTKKRTLVDMAKNDKEKKLILKISIEEMSLKKDLSAVKNMTHTSEYIITDDTDLSQLTVCCFDSSGLYDFISL